jgi:hypothetical protein
MVTILAVEKMGMTPEMMILEPMTPVQKLLLPKPLRPKPLHPKPPRPKPLRLKLLRPKPLRLKLLRPKPLRLKLLRLYHPKHQPPQKVTNLVSILMPKHLLTRLRSRLVIHLRQQLAFRTWTAALLRPNVTLQPQKPMRLQWGKNEQRQCLLG